MKKTRYKILSVLTVIAIAVGLRVYAANTLIILTPFCFSSGEGASWPLDLALKGYRRLFLQQQLAHGPFV